MPVERLVFFDNNNIEMDPKVLLWKRLTREWETSLREKWQEPEGFLSSRDEEVLQLTILQNLRDSDAAGIVGLSTGGVSYVRNRALKKLLESYEEVAERYYGEIPEVALCTREQIEIIKRYIGLYGKHERYEDIAAALDKKTHEVVSLHTKGIRSLVAHYFYAKSRVLEAEEADPPV